MVSGIVTAVLLLLFVIGCVWAFSPRRHREFDEAAQLPLREDEAAPEPAHVGDWHEEAVHEEGEMR